MSNETMKLILLTSLFVFVLSAKTHRQSSLFFTVYKCVEGHCQRTGKPTNNVNDLKTGEHTTLAACRLACDKSAGLWPEPKYFVTDKHYIPIHPDDFHLHVLNDQDSSVAVFLDKAFQRFLKNLRSTCPRPCVKTSTKSVTIQLSVESASLKLDWHTNESYEFHMLKRGDELNVITSARTVFGARHALETLSQLTAPIKTPSGENTLVILDEMTMSDEPVFPHRGLLIDTARNFLSVQDILRTIDALASTKMNVLHWHATDSQSFPLEIRSHPIMAKYGAYSDDKVYSTEDIAQIVTYAKFNGVRVILEVDTPSHAGTGWEWGESFGLGKLAVCVNQQPWRDYCIQPPCGQLNPVNPKTFDVLHDVYKDLLEIWGADSAVHLGGDEVFINCWNSTPEITTAMADKGLDRRRIEDFFKLWGDFHVEQLRTLDRVRDENQSSVIIWSSQLTSPENIEKYLDKSRFIVQTWVEAESDIPERLLDMGYQLIISTKDAWYLDHGFWGITKYHTWRDAYSNRIPKTGGVLGGEACMWGEYVNSGNFDSRVWPRTAAVAERLWSNPSRTSTAGVETRLQAHRERLLARGIFSEAIAPEWCAQHEGQCR